VVGLRTHRKSQEPPDSDGEAHSGVFEGDKELGVS